MDFNTTCTRISFVLSLLLCAGVSLGAYGYRLITPLAVSLLPTETATAKYTADRVMVEFRQGDPQQHIYSEIEYAGHKTSLLTTSPPTPFADLKKDSAQFDLDFAFIRAGLKPPPRKEPEEPTFKVRFVRAFPSLVVRDFTEPSLWRYYADTWTSGDLGLFLFYGISMIIILYFFIRHLRRSRRRYAW